MQVPILGSQVHPYNLVTQTLPTYTMSAFNIPSKICDSLDAALIQSVILDGNPLQKAR